MTADPSTAVPGQLDLLALLAEPLTAQPERDLYAASGLVFDTDRCRDGHHTDCTGIVHIHTGDVLHSTVSASSGPCRCTCHDPTALAEACAAAKHRCRGHGYAITTGWQPYQRMPCPCTCHHAND